MSVASSGGSGSTHGGSESHGGDGGVAGVHRWTVAACLTIAFGAEHAVRTAELYLAPPFTWLAPASGAALGALVVHRRRHAGEGAAYFFVLAAFTSLACSFVPFVAFGAGSAQAATFACVASSTAALAVAFGLSARSLLRWSWTLGLPSYALHPLRIFVVGVLCFAALALSASAGHLRGGPWIAASLSAVAGTFCRRHELLYARSSAQGAGVLWASTVAVSASAVAVASADRLLPREELATYAGEIIHARWGPSHRYVVTAVPAGHELFEDAALIASPLDGERRAAALVGPALRAVRAPRRALVLFGGLGAIERELAKAELGSVTVVADDAELGKVAAGLEWLAVRGWSAHEIVIAEPLPWLRDHPERWDVIVANLPPPLDHRAGKYYTRYFFQLLAERLAPAGAVSFPAVSALTARAAFEDVLATARDAGLNVTAHHAALPALGLASFLVGGRTAAPGAADGPGLFDTGADLAARGNGAVARLHDQRLLEVTGEQKETPPPPVTPK